MNFEVGDVVQWKSQSAGRIKKKTGTVYQVIEANRAAEWCKGDFSIEFTLPASARPERSYLVLVENVRKGRSGLYWPVAGNLKLVRIADRDRKMAEAGYLPIPPADAKNSPDHIEPDCPQPTRRGTLELPEMPERGPLDKACDNYLDQSRVVKQEKKKLGIMGEGLLSAMRKEGRLKLTLSSSEGDAWHFEALPTGYHLKVSRAKA